MKFRIYNKPPSLAQYTSSTKIEVVRAFQYEQPFWGVKQNLGHAQIGGGGGGGGAIRSPTAPPILSPFATHTKPHAGYSDLDGPASIEQLWPNSTRAYSRPSIRALIDAEMMLVLTPTVDHPTSETWGAQHSGAERGSDGRGEEKRESKARSAGVNRLVAGMTNAASVI